MRISSELISVSKCTSAWVSSNVEGSYKRSATLGMAIGWGNLNGAVTSNVVRLRITSSRAYHLKMKIHFVNSTELKINHSID